jgi:hypothetical protein
MVLHTIDEKRQKTAQHVQNQTHILNNCLKVFRSEDYKGGKTDGNPKVECKLESL